MTIIEPTHSHNTKNSRHTLVPIIYLFCNIPLLPFFTFLTIWGSHHEWRSVRVIRSRLEDTKSWNNTRIKSKMNIPIWCDSHKFMYPHDYVREETYKS